jgi:flagellar basal-body rod protein FlgG
MIRALQNSYAGVVAFQWGMDEVAHNLANVSTGGYKSRSPVFRDLVYRALAERRMPVHPGHEGPRQAGKGAAVAGVQINFQQGTLLPGERALDLAIEGDGFFRVIRADGTAAFTRRGDFYVDVEGNLVTAAGDLLDVPFSLENAAGAVLAVSPAGVFQLTRPDGQEERLGQILLYRFPAPAGLEPASGGVFVPTAASGAAEAGEPGMEGFGRIRQYCLEQSNVDLAAEMTLLLIRQRALQANSRALVTADELWALTLQAK